MLDLHESFLAALAILSAISGLVLAWLTHRRESKISLLEATSDLIEDFDRIRKALTEENARLARQLEVLRKQLNDETLKRVALEERLGIERELFTKRITLLERELVKLSQAINNSTERR